METRKIQKVGGGTYTVSIPAQWAKEHNGAIDWPTASRPWKASLGNMSGSSS
jgi:hypothetical protein